MDQNIQVVLEDIEKTVKLKEAIQFFVVASKHQQIP